ncbi:MAG: hypothetical protein ACFFEJ_15005 [Candidatus Thorarchaeota archaeon]
MEGRKVSTLCILIILMGIAGRPVAAQSNEPSNQEYILDSALGDAVYSMVIDEQNTLLLVGDRNPADADNSFELDGMLLRVTSEGEVSEIYVMDTHEVNSFTDVALDSDGCILLAGKGGMREGNQSAYLIKIAQDGEVMWSLEFPNIDPMSYIGIEMNRTTDEVFFVCTTLNPEGIFLCMVNTTGTIQWSDIWYEEGYLGRSYTTCSLHPYSKGFLLGVSTGPPVYYFSSLAERTVAFSSNGTELWSLQTGYEALYELDDGAFLCSGTSSVAEYSSNRELLWATDVTLHCDYHPTINGFTVNGTENIIAFGCVTGAGQSPVKSSFSLAFTPAIIPQTLIVSLNKDGEVEWYDFYVHGDHSSPCGAAFDQDGELVIAGYSRIYPMEPDTPNIWVVWDFHPTPFPDIIICDWIPIFLGLALIPVSLVLSWGLHRAHSGIHDRALKGMIDKFRRFGAVSGVIFFVFTGMTPLTFPIPWYGVFGLLVSLAFFITSYIMEYIVKHREQESVIPQSNAYRM